MFLYCVFVCDLLQTILQFVMKCRLHHLNIYIKVSKRWIIHNFNHKHIIYKVNCKYSVYLDKHDRKQDQAEIKSQLKKYGNFNFTVKKQCKKLHRCKKEQDYCADNRNDLNNWLDYKCNSHTRWNNQHMKNMIFYNYLQNLCSSLIHFSATFPLVALSL